MNNEQPYEGGGIQSSSPGEDGFYQFLRQKIKRTIRGEEVPQTSNDILKHMALTDHKH